MRNLNKLLLMIITTVVVLSSSVPTLKSRLNMLEEKPFRFPVGDKFGHGYYIAQDFQDPKMYNGTHLGIDISGIGKYNSDLGDTIYSINDGIVCMVANDKTEYISVYHKYKGKFIKAIYMHCLKVFPNDRDFVARGEAIALIGNSEGNYAAHLHLEIATDTTKWFGAYGWPDGYMDPMEILPYYTKKNK